MIFGLGNPGLRYKNTRHNVGFLTIDNFAKINKVRVDTKGYNSFFGRGTIGAEEIILLKPQLFMNNSGEAVRAAIAKLNADLKDVLIVCDDVNLELGVVRLRAAGSAGGHNGLKSVIENVGGNGFNRLRVGIGAKTGDILRDYVLSGFRPQEREILKEAVDSASDAIGVWITEGIESAMNKFNEKNK